MKTLPGFKVQIATPLDVMLACLPLLAIYALAIAYSLARRWRSRTSVRTNWAAPVR